MQYEERKKRYSRLQRWKHCLFAVVICLMAMFIPFPSEAATIDFNAKMTELQTKFPNGTYWNHVGLATDNSDGYTLSPCTLHKAAGVSHVYGTNGCTCNHFTGHNINGIGDLSATQCMGFAYKLGYDVFGATTWTRHANAGTAYLEIAVGDVVRISGSHTVFVTGKSGNVISVAEANYNPGCQISWGRTIDLTTVTITNYDRADNYAVVLGDVPAPPTTEATTEVTTEATTTEATTQATTQVTGSTFQKAKDGVHNCYYENGKLVKKQWFSVDGKDYYANEDGLILVSQWLYKGNTLVYVKADGSVARKELVNINGNTYFFKANGKRSAGWKKYDGKYYYCTKKGIVLKKQWIIKGRKRYYVQKDGSRAQNKYVKIKGRRYYFNRSGKMVAGR